MPSGHREAIVRPACTIRNNIVCKTTSSSSLRECFGYNRELFVCPSCVHRVTIGTLRVCVGSILAFYQIRDENRVKFKNSYSCGHRVSKSVRYDATVSPIKATNLSSGRLHHNLVCEKRCWSVSLPVTVRSSYKIYAHVHTGYFTGNYM